MYICFWCGGNLNLIENDLLCDTCYLRFRGTSVLDISDMIISAEEKEEFIKEASEHGFEDWIKENE